MNVAAAWLWTTAPTGGETSVTACAVGQEQTDTQVARLSATAIAGDLGEGMLGTIAPVKRASLPGTDRGHIGVPSHAPVGAIARGSTSHPGGAGGDG